MGSGSEADADGLHMGKKTEISARGTRGCGEVTELELSDRNDAKALTT